MGEPGDPGEYQPVEPPSSLCAGPYAVTSMVAHFVIDSVNYSVEVRDDGTIKYTGPVGNLCQPQACISRLKANEFTMDYETGRTQIFNTSFSVGIAAYDDETIGPALIDGSGSYDDGFDAVVLRRQKQAGGFSIYFYGHYGQVTSAAMVHDIVTVAMPSV